MSYTSTAMHNPGNHTPGAVHTALTIQLIWKLSMCGGMKLHRRSSLPLCSLRAGTTGVSMFPASRHSRKQQEH